MLSPQGKQRAGHPRSLFSPPQNRKVDCNINLVKSNSIYSSYFALISLETLKFSIMTVSRIIENKKPLREVDGNIKSNPACKRGVQQTVKACMNVVWP